MSFATIWELKPSNHGEEPLFCREWYHLFILTRCTNAKDSFETDPLALLRTWTQAAAMAKSLLVIWAEGYLFSHYGLDDDYWTWRNQTHNDAKLERDVITTWNRHEIGSIRMYVPCPDLEFLSQTGIISLDPHSTWSPCQPQSLTIAMRL